MEYLQVISVEGHRLANRFYKYYAKWHLHCFGIICCIPVRFIYERLCNNWYFTSPSIILY